MRTAWIFILMASVAWGQQRSNVVTDSFVLTDGSIMLEQVHPDPSVPFQVPKVPTVPMCAMGWHLERWHHGNDGPATYNLSVPIPRDRSGYRRVISEPKNPHPDKCVKDVSK